MTTFTKAYEIKARDFMRAGEASVQIKGLLKSVGFDSRTIRRVAICAYESEMNIVMHGSDGTLTLTVDQNQILVEAQDGGPGIENIEMALREGYSTATHEHREMGFGAGMGLPNCKRNADEFELRSQKGGGTHLRMCFLTDGSNP